jgi:hypothetical protein
MKVTRRFVARPTSVPKIRRKVWREQVTELNRESNEPYSGEPSDEPDPSWSEDEQLGAPFGPGYNYDDGDYSR